MAKNNRIEAVSFTCASEYVCRMKKKHIPLVFIFLLVSRCVSSFTLLAITERFRVMSLTISLMIPTFLSFFNFFFSFLFL